METQAREKLTDLFGAEVKEPVKQRGKAKGYAARPGTGPKGETCGTCGHCARTSPGRKNYYKCIVIRHRWTNGPGTDIKLKSPACSFFVPE